MAEEELQVVRIRDEFYRDGFYKALAALGLLLLTIGLVGATSVYLLLSKPAPVQFATDNEWRILPPVPLDKSYLPLPDLLQWVSDALPSLFTYDFINYTSVLSSKEALFTPNGWKVFLGLLNNYASYNSVLNSKLFLSGSAAGAPIPLWQGVLDGKYAWKIQMPINVGYSSLNKSYTVPLVIRALIVRVPTLNNLSGVAISDMQIDKGTGDQVIING